MKYKNKCIIKQIETNYELNQEFNDWLNENEYYILDIDELAKELGQEIIEKFKNTKQKCTWDNISAFVEDTLDEIREDLQYSVEEYLTNNWE